MKDAVEYRVDFMTEGNVISVMIENFFQMFCVFAVRLYWCINILQ